MPQQTLPDNKPQPRLLALPVAFVAPPCSMLFACVVFLVLASLVTSAQVQPHIILIVADDLGWRDVGFHGSSEIPTPNIDSLAYSGVILHNYYVQSLCTPSRAALLTARYPIHNGMQSYVITNPRCWGLDPHERILPEFLNALGYASHAVGKWHLGFCRRAFAPTRRGFASHFGLISGGILGMLTLLDQSVGRIVSALQENEMLENSVLVFTSDNGGIGDIDGSRGNNFPLRGMKATLYEGGIRAVSAIWSPLIEKPQRVFHGLMHISDWLPTIYHLAGGNVSDLPPQLDGLNMWPSLSRDEPSLREEVLLNIDPTTDSKALRAGRYKIIRGMLTLLDQSVGRIVSALQENEMLENSVLVFTSDNGGIGDIDGSRGNNFPLRGMKATLYEGGIRAVSAIWSPLIEKPQRVFHGLMHISDWLPTIYHLAGGNVSDLPPQLDGLNMWPSLSRDEPSLREEVLLNIDPTTDSKALRAGRYKIIRGPQEFRGEEINGWYGDPGTLNLNETTQPLYDETLEYLEENDFAGATLGDLGYLPSEEKQEMLREEAAVICLRDETNATACDPSLAPCVFDLGVDPCEQMNLVEIGPKAESERNGRFWPPDLLGFLESRLLAYEESMVPPLNFNVSEDPNADPSLWHGMWTNWLDNDTLSVQ
ncbi:unnamed protein product [Darwinula stevensoni]|uniref:Sulfatase N-terminal domain-containing protein n=1 Tax=Darwinula stevensoni TaxID=69355 RepID=A0A7R8XDX0_9CRUS|nr:unnamed protein product [Darwinula stevensoni]CAG0894733.1 unnamed protein product [Darwinula stevensoni]